MDNDTKIIWVYNFLNQYWKYLFEPKQEIPDIDTDYSDNDDDQYIEYDN